jgi:succinate-semialdehyde dehydrogenase / glutarate-semialdehyde dehydrogenase
VPERRGYFYEPTLIEGAEQGSGILSTEIFGPVALVVRFSDEADAIRRANATEYGLAACVDTRNLRRACRATPRYAGA